MTGARNLLDHPREDDRAVRVAHEGSLLDAPPIQDVVDILHLQIVVFNCLDLSHKAPDSSERQYKSSTRGRRFDPAGRARVGNGVNISKMDRSKKVTSGDAS